MTVVAAISANGVIALAKLFAAVLSGSAAMLAEGMHSLVDATNQGLLMLGIRLSRRPPDREHPFGYGKDVYFWAAVYACLLFGVGGGVSVYRGVSGLLRPEQPTSFVLNYVVLGVAFVAEAISWIIALRAVMREDRGTSVLDKLFRSKAPSRFVVVGEDTAAVISVVVAFIGLGLSQATGSPIYDAVASIVIGLLLAGSAIYLLLRCRSLLLGSATDGELLEEIRQVVVERDDVTQTGDALTMHVGPTAILVAMDVCFLPRMRVEDVAVAIDEIEEAIRALDDRVSQIFIEAQLRGRDILNPGRPPENLDAVGGRARSVG